MGTHESKTYEADAVRPASITSVPTKFHLDL